MFLAAIALVAAAGCSSPVSFNGVSTPASEAQPVNPIDVADNIPQCEIDIPQLDIQGNLNAFEFSFGYNAGGVDGGLGGSASIMVSSAQMDLSMTGTDPMMSTVLASTDVNATQTQTNINLQIDFGLWSLGPSYASSTPLATMTDKGLTTAIGNLKTQTDKIAWVGRVIYHNSDGTLTINAGTQNGLAVGDVYNLQNVTHYWSGTPCSSTYQGWTPDDSAPEGTLTITAAGPNSSRGTVTMTNPNTNHIRQGAEALVNTLVPAAKGSPARYLKKNVVLGNITSEPINLPGGGTFDFSGVLNSQVVNVINSSGAYVFVTPL